MNGITGALRRPLAVVAGVLLAAVSIGASAQAWKPEKTVEFVASSAPGGQNDQMARVIQQILQDRKLVPVPVSVLNKAGGNQTLSRTYINQFPGDAHYFDIGNPTLIANSITGLQQYTDFTPVALLVNEFTSFSVRADSPVKNAKDLVELLRKDPSAVAIGVSNRGGTNHLTMSLLARAAGISPRSLKIVVFKTNAEGLTGVMGGHIQLVASSTGTAVRAMHNGKIKIISVGSPQRMGGALADVPTLREQGFDVSLSNWRGIVGPKGLAPAPVAYWEQALAAVVATDEWKAILAKQFWDGHFLRSMEFADYMKKEYELTKGIMVELGLAK